jgi:hypothetical protein
MNGKVTGKPLNGGLGKPTTFCHNKGGKMLVFYLVKCEMNCVAQEINLVKHYDSLQEYTDSLEKN